MALVDEITARNAAWKICEEFCLDRVNEEILADLAYNYGIVVRFGSLTHCDARLIRVKERGIIKIKDTLKGTPRGLFSIGHELGHWFLHKTSLFECSDLSEAMLHDSTIETEANIFAAELLMPTRHYRRFAQRLEPSFESIELISKEFGVSRLAAAFTYVDRCPEAMLLIKTERKQIKWFRKSSKASPLWIQEKMKVRKMSNLAEIILRGVTRSKRTKVEVESWFDDLPQTGVVVEEQSEILSDDTGLTILWVHGDI